MTKQCLLLLVLVAASVTAWAQTPTDDLIAASKKGDFEAVKAAIAKGANVNGRTNYGATALHFAADRGYLEIVKALVEAGADVNVKDEFYKITPVMFAMQRKHKEVIGYLQEAAKAKPEAPKAAEAPAAAPTPAKPAVNPELNDAILDAAKKGDLAAVQSLLAKGADVNAKTRYSQTPLMLASDRGHLEIARALIAAGADLNVVDTFYKNFTALTAAVQKNHTEIAKLLLEKGAKGKENALVMSAMEGNRDLVEYIVKTGGLNQQLLDTALARAIDAEQKDTADALRKAGAKDKEKTALAPEVTVEASRLQKYAGTYRLDEARQYTFIVTNGKLGGWDVRQYSFPMTAIQPNVFRIRENDNFTITFNEENGKVGSITVNQNGFKQNYNRVEGK